MNPTSDLSTLPTPKDTESPTLPPPESSNEKSADELALEAAVDKGTVVDFAPPVPPREKQDRFFAKGMDVDLAGAKFILVKFGSGALVLEPAHGTQLTPLRGRHKAKAIHVSIPPG